MEQSTKMRREPEKIKDIFQLTKPEADLIMTIRRIEFGEIQGLKITDFCPTEYSAAKKTIKA